MEDDDMPEFWVATKSIILHGRKILLIKRSAYAGGGEGLWEIPGGGMKFGETLHEGLAREIREETGLTVRVGMLLYAMTAPVSPERQIVGLTYLSYANDDRVVLSHEHTEYLWATRGQVMELLNKPMLDDFMTNSVFDTIEIN